MAAVSVKRSVVDDDDASDADDGVVDHDVDDDDDDDDGDTNDDGDGGYKIRIFPSRFCLPVLNVGEKVSCLSLSYLPPRRISKYPDQIKALYNEFQGRFKSRRLHKPPIPVGLPFFFVKVSLFWQVTLLGSHLLTEKRTILCLFRASLKKSFYEGWRQH